MPRWGLTERLTVLDRAMPSWSTQTLETAYRLVFGLRFLLPRNGVFLRRQLSL